MYSYVLCLMGRILLRCLRGPNLFLLIFLGLVWMFVTPQDGEERLFLYILSGIIAGTVLAGGVMEEWYRERTED